MNIIWLFRKRWNYRDVLINVHSPHKSWSTLTFAVFGSSPSKPPLVREVGGPVCESVGKA